MFFYVAMFGVSLKKEQRMVQNMQVQGECPSSKK